MYRENGCKNSIVCTEKMAAKTLSYVQKKMAPKTVSYVQAFSLSYVGTCSDEFLNADRDQERNCSLLREETNDAL